jgi:tRNA modification GTPase
MTNESSADTIAAIATPPGRGGIGIVRLSGPQALALAMRFLRVLQTPLEPNRSRFCTLIDPITAEKLDEAVVTWFAAPRSYTGEEVVEIAAHGSPVLLDHLLRLLLAAGARLAEPGEFTQRAFLSGRIDLTQAEAVRDLIDAQTLLQAQLAARQLGGALSRHVAPLKQSLIALIALLEAGIDFAEDDTPVLIDSDLQQRLRPIEAALLALEQSFALGRLVSEGITLAIVGRPNAGKSSLFNRLLQRERAIVTAEPGTTRDTVQEALSLSGIPVQLIDTAGLRTAENEAERLGIARSREALADAGLVLLVLDSTELLNREEEELLASASARRLVIALNKCDLHLSSLQANPASATTTGALPSSDPDSDLSKTLPHRINSLAPGAPLLRTSALTGEGLDTLRHHLEKLAGGSLAIAPESALLTSLRQHTAVVAAHAAIQAAVQAAAHSLPHELLLLDLYRTLTALDELTGSTTPDDILNLIFSTFCIGK